MRPMLAHILILCRQAAFLTLLLGLVIPAHLAAQQSGTPVAIQTTDAPAELVEKAPIQEPAPEPVANESAPVPAEAEVIVENPAPVLPVEATVLPDEVSAASDDVSGTPAATPAEVPAPEPVEWKNTDTLSLNGTASAISLQSGASQSVSLLYLVTTPRNSTTIHALLIDDTGETPKGWSLDPDGAGETLTIDTTALLPGASFTTLFIVTAPTTPEETSAVSLMVWSETASDRGLEPGIGRQMLTYFTNPVSIQPASTPVTRTAVEPELTATPLDFGVMTWNGESWGSAKATTKVAITSQGEADLTAYDIQVELVGDVPGFRPLLTGVSASDDNVTLLATSGDPNVGPLSVARLSTDFNGTADLLLTFTLTPIDAAPFGTQHLIMSVTTMPAP